VSTPYPRPSPSCASRPPVAAASPHSLARPQRLALSVHQCGFSGRMNAEPAISASIRKSADQPAGRRGFGPASRDALGRIIGPRAAVRSPGPAQGRCSTRARDGTWLKPISLSGGAQLSGPALRSGTSRTGVPSPASALAQRQVERPDRRGQSSGQAPPLGQGSALSRPELIGHLQRPKPRVSVRFGPWALACGSTRSDSEPVSTRVGICTVSWGPG
jgi:hypothetical protein